MAIRKPLVNLSGQIAELPAGDELGVSANNLQTQLTNNNAGAVVIGTPVYTDAGGGFDKADASAAGTQRCIGLVADASVAPSTVGGVITDGVLAATTGQWDAVTGQVGGLTPGVDYYLDTTAGEMTTTAPTGSGEYIRRLGHALSTTEFSVEIDQSILLA